MKLQQQTTDRRFYSQLVSLALLTVLPLAMIAMNGSKAMQAILTPASEPMRGMAYAAESGSAKAERSSPLQFGVYDPSNAFADDKSLKVRHLYVSWADFDPAALAAALNSLEARGLEPFLTFEPWPIPEVAGALLPGILQGDYDQIIDHFASSLRGLKGPVYISWGHEMDQDLTKRYPWSNADPEQFVAAYRYVVDRIRGQVDVPLRFVWAGVLKAGSLRYWPGEDYADYVGMPVYSFPSWDRKFHGYIRDFPTTFEEKRKIVEELGKPLMITEFGVSGSADFESFWLHQAFLALDDYPDLTCVIFFYAKDADRAWGEDIETPDWRVHPDVIRGLVEWKLH